LLTLRTDIIRIRIAEEMDAPHRQHTAALEAEIEKFRNMYYSLRREYELFKANHETLQVDVQSSCMILTFHFQGESREALQEAIAKYEAGI
jgi:hypothetical protein